MAEDAWDLLIRFHREAAQPEFDRQLSRERATRAKLDLRFAEIHERFERLHSLNQEMLATLHRIEEANQNALEIEAEMKSRHASRH
jgi:flagellar biosynthesis/type III secretory pathway chaperone